MIFRRYRFEKNIQKSSFFEDGLDTFGEVALDTQGKTEKIAPLPREPKAAPD